MYLKANKFFVNLRKRLAFLEFQMVKVEVDKIVVVLVYRSPSFGNVDKFLQKLVELVDQERGPLIICGDFNIDPLAERTKYDSLQAAMSPFNLIHVLKRPTHLGGNMLDHVYINKQIRLKYSDLHHPYYSDHDATLVIVE